MVGVTAGGRREACGTHSEANPRLPEREPHPGALSPPVPRDRSNGSRPSDGTPLPHGRKGHCSDRDCRPHRITPPGRKLCRHGVVTPAPVWSPWGLLRQARSLPATGVRAAMGPAGGAGGRPGSRSRPDPCHTPGRPARARSCPTRPGRKKPALARCAPRPDFCLAGAQSPGGVPGSELPRGGGVAEAVPRAVMLHLPLLAAMAVTTRAGASPRRRGSGGR